MIWNLIDLLASEEFIYWMLKLSVNIDILDKLKFKKTFLEWSLKNFRRRNRISKSTLSQLNGETNRVFIYSGGKNSLQIYYLFFSHILSYYLLFSRICLFLHKIVIQYLKTWCKDIWKKDTLFANNYYFLLVVYSNSLSHSSQLFPSLDILFELNTS